MLRGNQQLQTQGYVVHYDAYAGINLGLVVLQSGIMHKYCVARNRECLRFVVREYGMMQKFCGGRNIFEVLDFGCVGMQ